jgi:asparagine synthase (glutamine-hydrolysing)
MTIIFGAVPRSDTWVQPPEFVESMVSHISRNPSHQAIVLRRGGALVAKVDIAAFDGPGLFEGEDGSISMVCGEPLLADSHTNNRQSHLRTLHLASSDGRLEVLRRCTGTFSFLHLSADGSQAVIATDHLGVRPLYYLLTRDLLVFSSTYRVLESLRQLTLTVDLRGLAEFATLGYCLNERTPIAEVSRLRPAEVIEVGVSGSFSSRRYFSWEEWVPTEREPQQIPTEEIHSLFQDAVARRGQSEDSAVAFLSGGLDSRVLVTTLADLGLKVSTYNFSIPGEQDEVFAQAFAESLGYTHVSTPRRERVSLWEAGWSFLLADSLRSEAAGEPKNPSRIAWSGDGGSVCVGAVYLSGAVEKRLHAGDLRGAADAFSPTLPIRVFPRKATRTLRSFIADGVYDELSAIDVPDPLRRFYLFLLFNDQRRHLDGHFEQIDLHCIEFQLPFFDAAFLKHLMHHVPVTYLQGHRFYHEWLNCFPQAVTSMPWQTYPGHLKCPVPDEFQRPAQWDDQRLGSKAAIARRTRRLRLNYLRKMLLSREFPRNLVSRPRLAVAGAAYGARVKDYGYLIDFAHIVFQRTQAASHVPPWPRT